MKHTPTSLKASSAETVDWQHYRALMRASKRPAADDDMDLDTGGSFGLAWRLVFYIIGVLLLAGVFVVLFLQFTNSWRIALVVVATMLGYMFIMSRMAEGRFDRRE